MRCSPRSTRSTLRCANSTRVRIALTMPRPPDGAFLRRSALKPNIVIVMTDQQSWDTAGPDSPCVIPHLDALRSDGVHFRNAFTPTPICTPARTSFQTGLLPQRHRMLHNAHRGKNYHIVTDFPVETPTIATACARAGYRTRYVGKWDSGLTFGPESHGYGRYIGPRELAPDGRWEENGNLSNIISIPGEKETRRALISAVTDTRTEDSYPMRMAAAVSAEIRAAVAASEPFYIFASCNTPHVPWICPAEYTDRHDPTCIQKKALHEELIDALPLSLRKHYNKQNFCRAPLRWENTTRTIAAYYGLISLIDAAIGRIRETLGECGVLENTIFVFTSDHGEFLGKRGLIGKEECLYDELIRIPLIFSWPTRFPSGERREFVSLTDCFATLVDLIGLPQEEAALDSRSLRPLLEGLGWAHPDIAYASHSGSMFFNTVRCVRTENFKYVFRAHESDELYDLMNDPDERVNLIADLGHSDTIGQMQDLLLEWMKATCDQAEKGFRYSIQYASRGLIRDKGLPCS